MARAVHSRASAEAEMRLCAGDPLAAAQLATGALVGDPADHEAHLVCAEAVAALGEEKVARDALVRLARIIADGGDLFLALAAALKARDLGAPIATILTELAAAYGAGSPRLREPDTARPPPMPRGTLPPL